MRVCACVFVCIPQVVFGCHVLQGYGMTENAAAAVVQPLNYPGCGNIGGPLPSTEVCVVVVLPALSFIN